METCQDQTALTPTLLLGLSKYFVDKPLALNQILATLKEYR